jgi:hypothetical protein
VERLQLTAVLRRNLQVGNHSFLWGWQYNRIWAHDGGCHVDKEDVWRGIGKGKALKDHLFLHQVFSFPFHHIHCHLITPRTSAANIDIIPVNKHPFMFSCLVIIHFHIFIFYVFLVPLTPFLPVSQLCTSRFHPKRWWGLALHWNPHLKFQVRIFAPWIE